MTQTRLNVHVQPNAKRNEILGFDGDILRLRVAAPPVEGKANKAVVALLSNVLHVPKSSISLTQGQKAKLKVFSIEGASLEGIKRKISSAVRE